jgi:hypothetical protein
MAIWISGGIGPAPPGGIPPIAAGSIGGAPGGIPPAIAGSIGGIPGGIPPAIAGSIGGAAAAAGSPPPAGVKAVFVAPFPLSSVTAARDNNSGWILALMVFVLGMVCEHGY